MRLGNDIVDLQATADHNPRFVDRILHPDEKSRHPGWNLAEPLIWTYWAIKEAAYKAIRQTTSIPFHHREFLVAADLQTVRYHQQTLICSVVTHPVFAICSDQPLDQCPSRIHHFADEPTPAEQSAEARRLLLVLAVQHLGLSAEHLRISTEGRIPRILYQEKTLPNPASLTHHGSYVAASLGLMASP